MADAATYFCDSTKVIAPDTQSNSLGYMQLDVQNIAYPLMSPFAITGYTFNEVSTVRVQLFDGEAVGHGEGVGAYYLGETSETIIADIEKVRPYIETGLSRYDLQQLLPRGGARNALDCALWDLEAKQTKKTIWELICIEPVELTTVITIGIDEPSRMGQKAVEYNRFKNLKLKLDHRRPVECVEAVRQSRPDANIIIDVNQGWSLLQLQDIAPHMARLGVAMIEQPLPRDDDEGLRGYDFPIPLGADESFLDSNQFEATVEKYSVLNIKLDKCGGLTEALKITAMALQRGVTLMVGNMMGTSLSMAPAYVVGQYCRYIDIDGPLALKADFTPGLQYAETGKVGIPDTLLWG